MDEIENERREREIGVAFEKSLIKLSVKRIKEIIKVVDNDSLAIIRFVTRNKDGKYEESIKDILDSNIQDIIQFLEKVDDKCRPFEKCFIRDIEYSEDAKNLFFTVTYATKHKRGSTLCEHYVVSFGRDQSETLYITDYNVIPLQNDCY